MSLDFSISNGTLAFSSTVTYDASGGDVTPPSFSAGPASASVDDTSFNITATLNEWGTVYSLVQAAAAAAPSVATIKATGESAIDTGSGVTISHTGLSASTDYTAYVVAADDDNNTQSSATEVDVTTLSSYDTDTQNWFGAGSFSDANKGRMDTFVLNLKTGLANATNVWSDLVALWWIAWGSDSSASNNAINGRNPGTYDLTFVNSPTYGSGGTVFNGSTQYAQTGLIPNSVLTATDISMGYYSVNAATGTDYNMGSVSSGTQDLGIVVTTDPSAIARMYRNNNDNRVTYNGSNNQFVASTRRSASDMEMYRNGASVGSNTNTYTSTLPTHEVYLAAANSAGSMVLPAENTFRLFFIGRGLSDNQMVDFDAAVDALISDLGL